MFNDRSNIVNNEKKSPEISNEDEDELRKKGRGPSVLEFNENPVKRSQTKYKRSKMWLIR